MRCLNFAAVAALMVPSPSEAQRVPGRDLLRFPLGSLAESPALALESGDGFQNPAAIRLADTVRLRATAVALNTGTERAVSAQLAGVAVALPQQITVGLSAARASIDAIARTDQDPQPLGRDIPYSTFVISLAGARRTLEHVTSGIAVRYRTGQLDAERRSTVGLDAGVIADRLFGHDARLGLTSFLWSPGSGRSEEAAFSAAADARVVGVDPARQVRAGYSYTGGDAASSGHYIFASGRFSYWLGRVGIARGGAINRHRETTVRLALGVRYARYTVGLSREESAGGFDPTYQFLLGGTFR